MANDPLTIQPQNLNPFDRLPEAVRDWLNSTEVLMTLISIEEQFSIRTENIPVIPFAITSLVTDKIEPAKFAYALEIGLKIPRKDAETIAGIVKEKILNHIAAPLQLVANINISSLPGANAAAPAPLSSVSQPLRQNLGGQAAPAPVRPTTPAIAPTKPLITGTSVDAAAPSTSKPFLNRPTTLPAALAPVLPPSSEKKLGEQVTLSSAAMPPASKAAPVFSDIKPVAPMTKPQSMSEVAKGTSKLETLKAEKPLPPPAPSATTKTGPKPFMLHEEKPSASSMADRQSFSFSVPTSTTNVPKPLSASARPVEAQFGSAFESYGKKTAAPSPETARTAEQKPKIVHYSAFRTLVNEKTGLPTQPKEDAPAQ